MSAQIKKIPFLAEYLTKNRSKCTDIRSNSYLKHVFQHLFSVMLLKTSICFDQSAGDDGISHPL